MLLKSNQYVHIPIDEPAFQYKHPNWFARHKIERVYHLSKIPKGRNEFSHFVNVMRYVSELFFVGFEKEVELPVHHMNCIGIYKNVIEEGKKANCWMHAITLTELYLALGYKARLVRLLPYNGLDAKECHCITLVYSNQYHKWVVMDAANKTYYLGEEVIPLDIIELKERLINHKKVIFPFMEDSMKKGLREYLRNNIYYLQSYQLSCFDVESPKYIKKQYILHPEYEHFSNYRYRDLVGSSIDVEYIDNVSLFMQIPSEVDDKKKN